MAVRFVIIGGGPAGNTAATTAASLGAEVTMIERDIVGGAAHLWDCIPSKAMVATGNELTELQHATTMGLEADGRLDVDALRARIAGMEATLRDSVTGGFNHQLGRRASWSSQAGYMRGNVGFGSDARHFDAYNAGAGVNIAVSRRFGVFTDYSFYRYDVPAGATVFTSLQKFSRQSVTAGLTLWVPLISERSSRDPR